MEDSSTDALDIRWFSRIKKINAQIPRYLKPGNYREAKTAFFSRTLLEPPFTYPQLQTLPFHHKIVALKELQHDIEHDESNEYVRSLYLEKIEEKLRQFQVLDMLQRGPLHYEPAALTELIESIYGRPDQNVFNQLLLTVRDRLRITVAADEALTEVGRRLESVVSVPVSTTIPPFSPLLPQDLLPAVYYQATAVVERIETALPQFGLTGWHARITKEKVGGFKVWPNSRMIVVPTTKMLRARRGERILTEAKLEAVIQHEVATHAVRAERGRNSKLALLGIGLAGYLRGEEGIASYREQLVLGADDYANQAMHLAIGLAYGLDRDGERRTFREVFLIMADYFYIFGDHSVRSARQKSFTACARIFKYATGAGTAFVMTKDIAYREGNIAIHQLVNKQPDATAWFDVGKFDPTNERHMRMLHALAIL